MTGLERGFLARTADWRSNAPEDHSSEWVETYVAR